MSAAVHPMACPVCRSVDVTGDEWEMDGEASQAWQQVSCDDCGSRWADVYAYSHQEISRTGSVVGWHGLWKRVRSGGAS